MRLIVQDEIFGLFPGLHLAMVVAEGIDHHRVPQAVSREWWRTWEAAGKQAALYGNAQSHPRVRPWRERLRALGVSGKFPSSVEALLQRALKGRAVQHQRAGRLLQHALIAPCHPCRRLRPGPGAGSSGTAPHARR